jgi:hypothetical protein
MSWSQNRLQQRQQELRNRYMMGQLDNSAYQQTLSETQRWHDQFAERTLHTLPTTDGAIRSSEMAYEPGTTA